MRMMYYMCIVHMNIYIRKKFGILDFQSITKTIFFVLCAKTHLNYTYIFGVDKIQDLLNVSNKLILILSTKLMIFIYKCGKINRSYNIYITKYGFECTHTNTY